MKKAKGAVRKARPAVKPVKESGTPQSGDAAASALPIVGFGASAGGLQAFTAILESMPADSGLAIVLVQHLHPEYASELSALLSRVTTLRVTEATEATPVEPNRVYVIPPNKDLTISGGVLNLEPRPAGVVHMPIDRFFRSLAEDQGNKAIGVVLSGTASDGSQGLRAIKGAGGITFAQTPETAQYSGMPNSAIATGCVDFVLPPEQITAELLRLRSHPYLREPPQPDIEDAMEREERAMRDIFTLLRNASGVDFSLYKRGTIHRRTMRRMALLKMETLDQYATFLRQHPDEMSALFQDILINVTAFFREPVTFEALKTRVFPELFKNRSAGDPVRVWVPGCATGEDPYSIAICLFEYMRDAGVEERVQIFGTDLSDRQLEKARSGVYPENISADVSADRLRRFFVRVDVNYQIARSIRDCCVFARQNVTKDPPFSKLDLILCRNLLIYLGPTLQNTVMRLFNYALRPDGYLVLGLSESVGGATDLFSPVDKRLKIYSKRPVPLQLHTEIGGFQERGLAERREPAAPQHASARSRLDHILLARYSPPAVLLDRSLRVLEFRGHTADLVEHASGEANLDLAKMMSSTVAIEVQRLVRKVQSTNASAKGSVTMVQKDRSRHLEVTVVPVQLDSAGEHQYLAIFEEAALAEPPQDAKKLKTKNALAPSTARMADRVKDLERELSVTREYLQNVVEEQEASTEELKSAHEEVQSGNEELQSTNEELLTAKEELQSTNEELTTVNEEMQNRNAELLQINNDLLNLLSSVNIPTVMLSSDLRIRRFTPQAEKLFNLLSTDVGRPISDLRLQITIPDLVGSCREVLDDLTAREREVQDHDGRTYSMWIRPYRTAENRIDGVVLALFDITERKQSAEARYRRLFEASTDGILVAEASSGVIVDVNPALLKLSGNTRQQLLGKKFWESPLFPERAWDKTSLAELHESESLRKSIPIVAPDGKPIEADLVCNTYAEGDRKVFQFNLRDTGARRRSEAQLQQQQEQLRQGQKMEAVGRLAGNVAHDFNDLLTALLGFCDLLDDQLDASHIDHENLEQVRLTAERAVLLTNQLLAFGRRQPKAFTQLDMNEIVGDMQKLILVMLPPNVQFVLRQWGGEVPVNGDRGQMEQVVMNLVLNARDALPQGGRIELRTDSLIVPGSSGEADPPLPAGEYVSLTVQDNGVGMTPETQARLFEPFFTTKPKGEGVGLGLATTYNIVQQCGGFISAASTLGVGTTFSVYLPRSAGKELAVVQAGEADYQGTETLLLVDDEPAVREVAVRYLTLKGYRVLAAPGGPEAIQIAKEYDGEIAALVTDVVMPNMSGREVAFQLAMLRPTMKVMYMSGHTEEAIRHHGVLDDGNAFLHKPFKMSELGAKLREVLDR